jgi:hypothetical protein
VRGNCGSLCPQINQCVVHATGALLLDRPDDFDTDAVLRTGATFGATASTTAPGTFDPTAGMEVEEENGGEWGEYDDGGHEDGELRSAPVAIMYGKDAPQGGNVVFKPYSRLNLKPGIEPCGLMLTEWLLSAIYLQAAI